MAGTGERLIHLEGIKKVFYTDEVETHALADIHLEVKSGEYVAISGPSGCGKTTLLSILGLLDSPSEGQYLLAGEPVANLTPSERARIRNRQIGFIFQAHHLLPQCSVLENVLVPTLADSKSTTRDGAEARAKKLLDRVGLGSRLNHRPGQLSGGERQRVAVVRALINGPKLLLADEPTGALDRASAASLADLLVELNREEGVTLITVTHAADLAHRMRRALELQDGALLQPAT